MPEKIQQDVEKLEELATEKDHKQSLERLSKAAHSGASLKWWFNRLLFGFNLADAVEQWLNAFDPKIGKPIKEQIPKVETKEVIAAWMKFSLRSSIILLLLSSSVTLVTAFFLWNQIQKQDELIKVQTQKNELDQRFLYLQVLYDEVCTDSEETKEPTCVPKYNNRQREEAAKNFLITNKNLSGAQLERINLSQFELRQVNLRKSDLLLANLSDTDLSEADLSEADLSEADLRGANLREAKLFKANLSNSSLFKANLNKALLFKVNLSKADLSEADLRGANLREAKLFKANLSNSSLFKANLNKALLFKVNLSEADLKGVNLSEADLKGVNLSEADLEGANLEGANLEGANLEGANLEGAKLEQTILTRANYDEYTDFPKGFNPKENGMILAK